MADKKITLKVLSQAGEEVSTVSVSSYVFGQEEATQAVHDAIVVYQANMRQDTAKTKKRDEVSGGGKKPWRQKAQVAPVLVLQDPQSGLAVEQYSAQLVSKTTQLNKTVRNIT